jgi:hypothetical protein
MRTPGLALVTLLCASLSSAQGTIWRQEPDSDWMLEVPDPDAPAPTTPGGGFANPNERIFRDQLGRGIADRLCRRASLDLHQDFDISDIGGVGGRFNRRLRQVDENTVAVMDTIPVRFRVGHTFPVQVAEHVNLNFYVGASAELESTVIRPRPGRVSCEELLTLVDIRHVKTVFPFRASRISNMAVGEIWKLPVRLSWGYAPSIGGGAEGLAVSVTAGGRTRSGQAALSLYRMDANRLRMRFRLEDAVIYNHGGSILGTAPAIAVGSLGANIIAEAVDSVIAKELAKFVQSQLAYFNSSSDGQSIIFEQILDPNDAEQMEALSEVVRGDLRRIISLLIRRRGLIPKDRPAAENAEELSRHYRSVLNGSQVSVLTDTYRREADGWTLRLPLITRQGWRSASGSDQFERLGDDREEVRIYHADRNRERGYLYLPIVGAIVNDNSSDSGQAITAVRADGPGPVAAVYIRQNAFERVSASGVREEFQRFSDLTALIGRESGSPRTVNTALPVDRLFPAGEARFRTVGGPRNTTPQESEHTFDRGSMVLSLLISPEGMTQAVAAAPDAVLRAYANTLDASDRAVLNAVAASGFDPADVRRAAVAAAEAAGDTVSPRRYIQLAERAAEGVADIARLRGASDNDRRAAFLAQMIDGRGESGLRYDEFMAILVQLSAPEHVRADFRVNVKKGVRGLENVNQRMRYNGGIDSEPIVAEAARLRGPFAGPQDITD